MVSPVTSAPATNPYLIEGPAVLSFSGGRTSAYLLRKVLDAHCGRLPDDVHALFANTGKERKETLDFVAECAERWAVEVHWLEYRPYVRGTPLDTHYTETTYEHASMNGEPFDTLIEHRKRLPNPLMRICTQELKIRPMREWMKARGYSHWKMIIGLRADEPHRVAKMNAANDAGKERWTSIMPLARAGVTEEDVLAFWKAQPFDLRLKTWEGNCDLCFLKAHDKKVRIMQDHPTMAAWWLEKEAKAGQPFRRQGASYSVIQEQARRLPTLQPIKGALDELGDCLCTD